MMHVDRNNYQSEELAKRIRETYVFDERIKGWQLDDDFRQDGGITIYSVDTDILALYIDRQNREYTKIFSKDKEEFKAAVAEGIVDSIFFEKLGHKNRTGVPRSLVLLPGIDKELVRVIGAIVSKLATEAENAAKNAKHIDIEEEIRTIESIKDNQNKLQYFSEALPDHYAVFFGDNTLQQKIQRITRISREFRLTALARIDRTMTDRFPLQFVECIRRLPAELNDERRRVRAAIEQKVARSSETSPESREADVEALSWLIALNQHLKPEGIRIIHITGTESLLAGCQKLSIGRDGRLLDHGTSGSSVTEAYLRHPLAFWRSPEFKRSFLEGVSGFNIDDWTQWVNPLLPSTRPLKRRVISETARKVQAENPRALHDFERKWENFSLAVISAQALALGRFNNDGASILRNISSLYQQLYEEFLESSALLGLAVTSKIGGAGLPSRLLPIVMFDANRDADTAIYRVIKRLEGDKYSYQAAFTELRKAGANNYFMYIAISVLFTREKQYKAAMTYASMAIQTAQELPRSQARKEQVSGREAYYLMAVLLRTQARKYADFVVAQRTLVTARYCLNSVDREINPEIDITDFRFNSEELAHKVSRFLFDKFVGKVDPHVDLDEITKMGETILSTKISSRERRHSDIIYLRTYVNMFSIMIHHAPARRRITTNDKELERWRNWYQTADAIFIKLHTAEKTYLHKVVLIVARAVLFGCKIGEAHCMQNYTGKYLSNEEIRANSVLIYDDTRLKDLREVCRTVCAWPCK